LQQERRWPGHPEVGSPSNELGAQALDPAIHALLQETKLEQRLQSIAKAMRLQWPILNLRVIDSYKKRMRKEELKSWSQPQSKGRGVALFTGDRNGYAWLYNPNLKIQPFSDSTTIEGWHDN